MTKRISVLAGAAAVALTALAPLAGHAQEGLPVGSKAPSFRVKTLKGKTLDPTRQRGKVVVMDFWATWCGPCKMAIPVLQQVHDQYGKKGVMVLGISNEPKDVVAPYAARSKMTYALAADPALNSALAKYNVRGIPTLVVLDKKGNVRLYEIGFNPNGTRAKLEATIRQLLAEKV